MRSILTYILTSKLASTGEMNFTEVFPSNHEKHTVTLVYGLDEMLIFLLACSPLPHISKWYTRADPGETFFLMRLVLHRGVRTLTQATICKFKGVKIISFSQMLTYCSCPCFAYEPFRLCRFCLSKPVFKIKNSMHEKEQFFSCDLFRWVTCNYLKLSVLLRKKNPRPAQ